MAKVKLSVFVPPELHRQAKYAAIERGTTIQHVVEDSLQRSLDPTRSTAPGLKPKEVNMAHTQLNNILQSGNEDLINSCLACLRGGHGILQLAEKVTTMSPATSGLQRQGSEEVPTENVEAPSAPPRLRKKKIA
jgi:DNA-binding phage protein